MTLQSIHWSKIMFKSLNLVKIVAPCLHCNPMELAIASFSSFGHQGHYKKKCDSNGRLSTEDLENLYFDGETFKTFIFLRKPFIFRKSCFFSVFRVPRSYKILYFQQCPILFYILSICLIFQGI